MIYKQYAIKFGDMNEIQSWIDTDCEMDWFFVNLSNPGLAQSPYLNVSHNSECLIEATAFI